MIADIILKYLQIVFYLVATVVGVLTYLSAKRGLLNTVNTEYQKRVMDRLAFLARELYDEFDPDSPNYWARESPLSATLDEINQEFRRNRRSIIKAREFIGGSLVSKEYLRLDKLLTSIITDPFIPHVVRAKVVEFLQNRINTIEEVHSNEIDKYRSELAKGLVKGRLSEYKNVVHNRVVDSLGERGFGVSQVEQSVNQIRLEIQKYFESFDPLR